MYESRTDRLLPRPQFFRRVLNHLVLALGVVHGSLLLAMWGYHHFESLAWVDAFLNTSVLLGGMGPVDPPQTPGGKLFAGGVALYSGLVFLVAVALVLAPIFHRGMHRFHWDEDGQD